MVVRSAITMGWRLRHHYWPPTRAAVLLAGIAMLSSQAVAQTGGISAFSPEMQEHVIAPTTYSTGPLGLPNPAWFSLGVSGVGVAETQGTDPAVAAQLGEIIADSTDELGVGAGSPIPTIKGVVLGGIPPVCEDDQLEARLQAGGEFFTSGAVNPTPVQFPPGVFTGSSLGHANFLADPMLDPNGRQPNPPDSWAVASDPTLNPSGDPTNLPQPGPAGGWCRPLPPPFADSSPLENRMLRILASILLIGAVVFLLSRGVKLPAHSTNRSSSLVNKRAM